MARSGGYLTGRGLQTVDGLVCGIPDRSGKLFLAALQMPLENSDLVTPDSYRDEVERELEDLSGRGWLAAVDT